MPFLSSASSTQQCVGFHQDGEGQCSQLRVRICPKWHDFRPVWKPIPGNLNTSLLQRGSTAQKLPFPKVPQAISSPHRAGFLLQGTNSSCQGTENLQELWGREPGRAGLCFLPGFLQGTVYGAGLALCWPRVCQACPVTLHHLWNVKFDPKPAGSKGVGFLEVGRWKTGEPFSSRQSQRVLWAWWTSENADRTSARWDLYPRVPASVSQGHLFDLHPCLCRVQAGEVFLRGRAGHNT